LRSPVHERDEMRGIRSKAPRPAGGTKPAADLKRLDWNLLEGHIVKMEKICNHGRLGGVR